MFGVGSVPYRPVPLDFSWLAKLPEAYQEGQQYQREQALVDAFKSGNVGSYGDMAKLAFQSGNPQAGIKLIQAQAEADQRNQPTWAIAPSGESMYIARGQGAGPQSVTSVGGGEGPTSLAKPKALNITDADKLDSIAQSTQSINDLAGSFKTDYAGYGPGAETRMGLAKQGYMVPGITSSADKEAAQWWDSYGQWEEPIRKGLYGAVLTPNERADFTKYRVTPNTDPGVVQDYLEKQKNIWNGAVARKRAALIASGYSQNAIDSVLPAPTTQQPSPNGQGKASPLSVGQVVAGYKYLGGDPNNRASWAAAQ